MNVTPSVRKQWMPGGVWRSPTYVRLWSASVISALGSAVTTLALPLLAAITLNATGMVAAGQVLVGLALPTYEVNQFSLRQAVTPLRLQGRINASPLHSLSGAS